MRFNISHSRPFPERKERKKEKKHWKTTKGSLFCLCSKSKSGLTSIDFICCPCSFRLVTRSSTLGRPSFAYLRINLSIYSSCCPCPFLFTIFMLLYLTQAFCANFRMNLPGIYLLHLLSSLFPYHCILAPLPYACLLCLPFRINLSIYPTCCPCSSLLTTRSSTFKTAPTFSGGKILEFIVG